MAEWESVAADQLSRFEDRNATKKRATVIALIDARLAGRAEETVWRLPDTCSRTIYHNKWKKDPVFADVLERVEASARKWHDGRTVRALAQAAERLALAAPAAVGRAILTLNDDDSRVALAAAFGILDRAGIETAAKSAAEITGVDMTLEEWRKQQAERRGQAAAALAEFAEPAPNESNDPE